MVSKLARWLAAASLLVIVAAPALAVSSSTTGQGWLGVTTQPTDDDLRKGLDLTQDGLLVNQVTRDSPAYRAGVRKGDVILTYNSRSVTTPDQLRDLVRDTDPGRSVALGVWRDGARKSLTVKLGDLSDSGDVDSYDVPVPPTPPSPPSAPRAPKAPRSTRVWSDDGDVRMWVDGHELTDDEIKEHMKDMKVKLKGLDDLEGSHVWTWGDGPGANMFMSPTPRRGRLGVRVDDLNDDMANALGVPAGKGALVTEVLEDTPAQKAGIRAGDVIVRVEGETVDEPGDLTKALAEHTGKVSIELLRKGDRRTVEADIPARSRSSLSRTWSLNPEPGYGSRGYWKTKGDDDGDADLRREIEDLKRELQELREQLKTKK